MKRNNLAHKNELINNDPIDPRDTTERLQYSYTIDLTVYCILTE